MKKLITLFIIFLSSIQFAKPMGMKKEKKSKKQYVEKLKRESSMPIREKKVHFKEEEITPLKKSKSELSYTEKESLTAHVDKLRLNKQLKQKSIEGDEIYYISPEDIIKIITTTIIEKGFKISPIYFKKIEGDTNLFFFENISPQKDREDFLEDAKKGIPLIVDLYLHSQKTTYKTELVVNMFIDEEIKEILELLNNKKNKTLGIVIPNISVRTIIQILYKVFKSLKLKKATLNIIKEDSIYFYHKNILKKKEELYFSSSVAIDYFLFPITPATEKTKNKIKKFLKQEIYAITNSLNFKLPKESIAKMQKKAILFLNELLPLSPKEKRFFLKFRKK